MMCVIYTCRVVNLNTEYLIFVKIMTGFGVFDSKSGFVSYRDNILDSGLNPMDYGNKKVQVGKDQENAQSEKDSHSKNRGGKKLN